MFVIAGATGNTGSIVADTLLSQGKKVRVLVRDAAKAEALRARGAEVVVGTLDDAAVLARAFDGASGAYVLSPPDVRSDDLLAQRRATFTAIASAIDAAKLPHVVLLSSIGAQHETGTGPIRAMHDAERRLSATTARATFVRAASFVENWASVLPAAQHGKLPTFQPADLPVPQVTTRDIGLAAARALIEGPPREKVDVIELSSGARDLSARDVANVVGEILGRPVEPEVLPMAAVVPTFTSYGMSAPHAALFQEMLEGIANGKVAWEGGRARPVRGATDPKAVLAKLLGR